ncbi:MAG: MFS transporter [Ignisphaera sp.]
MSGEGISNLKAFLYGYGNLMGIGSSLIVGWLLYYYCPPENSDLPLLAPIVVMGAAMLFGRAIDAISDPLIGYWSDRTLSRWGRRRPFILAGFIAMTFSQVAVWRPLVQGYSLWNAVYASTLLGIFWFGYTAAIAPYLALLPEIASSSSDRVKLVAYQTLFSQLSLVIGGVAVPVLLGRLGYLNTSIVLTIIATTSMLPIVLVFREKPIAREKIAEKLDLWRALRITYTNRVFIVYLIPTALLVLSTTIVQIVLPYLVTVSAGLEASYVAIVYLPLIAVSILTLPLYRKLASRYGKKRVYMLGMALFAIPTIATSLVGIVSVEPVVFLVAMGALFGFFATPLLMLPNAFIADITDIDEKITGYRREAIYFGAQGFVTKSMAGLAGVLSSIFLEYLGYTTGADLGIRISFIFSSLILVPAVVVFSRYPLAE